MADLITGLTDYPTVLDTQTSLNNETDDIIAEHINGPAKAIVAIENALGTSPEGTAASLKARLAILLADTGGIHSGIGVPSPALSSLTHFYFDTQSETTYIYNVNTAQYDAVSTATVLADYLRKSSPDTITAQHTFNPAGVAPFTVGAAVDETVTVTDLNADLLDGLHASQIDADKVDGQHRVLTINADHDHSATGAMGGVVDHTVLTSKGTNTHAQIDTFIASKAGASGIASLNASTKVVEDPANAQLTAAASKIPLASSDGTISGGYLRTAYTNFYDQTVGGWEELSNTMALPDVTAGDLILVTARAAFAKALDGRYEKRIYKSSGTATISAAEGYSFPISNEYLSGYALAGGDMTMVAVILVTGSGTLTLAGYFFNEDAATPFYQASLSLSAIFLRKQ